jgi:hypothetical protein
MTGSVCTRVDKVYTVIFGYSETGGDTYDVNLGVAA